MVAKKDTEAAKLAKITAEKVKTAYASITGVEQALAAGAVDEAKGHAADAERVIRTLPSEQRPVLRQALKEAKATVPTMATESAEGGGATAAEATVGEAVMVTESTEGEAEGGAESSELVTLADTTDYMAVAGMPELVEAGAAKIAEGAVQFAAGNSLAREIATILVDARVHLIYNGAPDLKAVGNPAKMTSRAMFISALDQSQDTSEDTRAAYEKLQKAVQNVIPDVLVDYVRALDNSPEEVAEHFKAATTAYPDLSPSEAVFTYHDLPRKGRAELMREARAARKLAEIETAAALAEAKALAGTFEDKKEGAAVVAALAAVEGERVSFDSDAEDEAEGNADSAGEDGGEGGGEGDGGPSTPRAFTNMEKIAEAIAKLQDNAPKLKNEIQAKALRAEVTAAINALTKVRNTL